MLNFDQHKALKILTSYFAEILKGCVLEAKISSTGTGADCFRHEASKVDRHRWSRTLYSILAAVCETPTAMIGDRQAVKHRFSDLLNLYCQ